jgi:hypothetical protein
MDRERASCGEDAVFTCRYIPSQSRAQHGHMSFLVSNAGGEFSLPATRRALSPHLDEALADYRFRCRMAAECRVHDWAESMPRKPNVRRGRICPCTCLAGLAAPPTRFIGERGMERGLGGLSGELLLAWPCRAAIHTLDSAHCGSTSVRWDPCSAQSGSRILNVDITGSPRIKGCSAV